MNTVYSFVLKMEQNNHIYPAEKQTNTEVINEQRNVVTQEGHSRSFILTISSDNRIHTSSHIPLYWLLKYL